ncbi:zinc finger MYM-type protein 1-like [Tubulanus polymorphus]|uniref:zinc finger MYM-type protein 1-like n=1 Tax=Tubulanus polymorphus TaxID=672921 RepID=UPI003DA5EB90
MFPNRTEEEIVCAVRANTNVEGTIDSCSVVNTLSVSDEFDTIEKFVSNAKEPDYGARQQKLHVDRMGDSCVLSQVLGLYKRPTVNLRRQPKVIFAGEEGYDAGAPTKEAKNENKLANSKTDKAFIERGFSNWKEANRVFKDHEGTKCHKEAMERVITLPNSTKDVGESLSEIHAKEKIHNKSMLRKLFENVRFLGRQGLPFRGHDTESGHFIQLFKLRASDDSSMLRWLDKKRNKYVSHDSQNELINVLAMKVLRTIVSRIKESPFFSIMVDEATDNSNKEQMVIVLRWVASDLSVHEDFIGMYHVSDITVDTLAAVVHDVLTRLNLSYSQCRGQCYDGASNMTGKKSGLAAKVQAHEPRAVFIHCYGHSLNLAANDAIKAVKVTKDDISHEICKLVKYSPRRDGIFHKIKEELEPNTPGLRVLCPTRWTVRAASLSSILDNYQILLELWEQTDYVKDTDTKARIIGVQSQMKQWDFFWGVNLARLVLRHADNLSKTLQNPNLTAAAGQKCAMDTLSTLRAIRTDRDFDLFYDTVLKMAQQTDEDGYPKLEISDPKLPRRRNTPARFEMGNAAPEHPGTPRDYFRSQYFDVLDRIIISIESRFDQEGFNQYKHLQDLIINACNGRDYEEQFSAVVSFYGSDFDSDLLQTQLKTLEVKFCDRDSDVTLQDIIDHFKAMLTAVRCYLSEICTVLNLILVLPATNATSEKTDICTEKTENIFTFHLNANITE